MPNYGGTAVDTYGNFVTVVEHGATASTARPTGAVRVFWRGTVAPTNATQYDRWINTTSAPYVESIFNGATWDVFGSSTYVSTIGRASGGDDTAAINALLANPSNLPKLVKGLPGQAYKINTALVIDSGVTLDMTGCSVTKTTSTFGNMLVNRATVNPAATATGATTTIGSATLTTTLAAGVGMTVVVPGAGGSTTAPGPLVATVTAVGAGSLTMNLPAVNAVNATVNAYVRDKNITIKGGFWNRGNNPDPGPVGHALRFRRVDGLAIDLDRLDNATASSYGIAVGDCTDFAVNVAYGYTLWDMVHVNGPARNGAITARGTAVSADIVALTCRDYSAYEDTCGNIDGVEITAYLDNSHPVLLLAGQGQTLSNAQATVYGTAKFQGAGIYEAIRIIDDTGSTTTQGGAYKNIRARVRALGNLHLTATGVVDIVAEVWQDTTDPNMPSPVQIDAGSYQHLDVTVRIAAMRPGAAVVYVNPTSIPIGRLTVRGKVALTGNTQSVVQGAATANITVLDLTDLDINDTGGAQVVYFPNGGTLPDVYMRGVRCNGSYWLVDLNTVTTLHLSCLTAVLTGGWGNIRAAAVVRILADASARTSSVGANIVAGGTLGGNGLGFRIDLATVNNKVDGDMVVNTNGALSCGAGPAVYRTGGVGVGWKSLYAATTY